LGWQSRCIWAEEQLEIVDAKNVKLEKEMQQLMDTPKGTLDQHNERLRKTMPG